MAARLRGRSSFALAHESGEQRWKLTRKSRGTLRENTLKSEEKLRQHRRFHHDCRGFLGMPSSPQLTTALYRPDHDGSYRLRYRLPMPNHELDRLRDRLRDFARERDWDQFHSPKNLCMALSGEVGELLEHFQWLTEEQSAALPAQTLREVELEMADVLLYLIRLADKLGVDLTAAASHKIEMNAAKYPADQCRGSAHKRPANPK
jgi:dCTP diphosphatase